MNNYIKAMLGGILAVLAAFGWAVTLAFVIAWKNQQKGEAWGLDPAHAPLLLIILFLVFAVGFYLGFRKIY
jgi:H+/Cl- antiporter ClcA